MKKLLFLLLISNLASTPTFGQVELETPPGTIQLKKGIFIDKTPVTNIMFLEYLTAKHFLRKKGFSTISDYHKSIEEPIEGLVLQYPSFLKNLNRKENLLARKNYFEKTKYKYAPVLNISKEQAEDFCKWRTEMVQYYWTLENIDQNLKYRLPAEAELNSAKKYYLKNGLFKFYDGKNPMKFKTTEEVSNFVVYNISEFTISERIFGENWQNRYPTEFPNEATGFRCVCETAL